jgi:hypothetical protein
MAFDERLRNGIDDERIAGLSADLAALRVNVE